MKVQIFTNNRASTLEESINKWLGDNSYITVKDTQYSVVDFGSAILYTAAIWYTKH